MKEYSKYEVRKIYDEGARWYNFTTSLLEFCLRKFRKKLIGKAEGKILETSIGTGVNFSYYPKNSRIFGIDLSKEMLKKAKTRAKKYGKKVDLREGDAQNLPFKNNEFDYVVDTLGLCTFSDPVKALKEMKRVCKTNGRVLLLEHGIGSNKIANKFLKWNRERHYKKYACHLTRDIIKIVREAGLKIEEKERGFFGIFYIIIAKP